MLPWSLLFLALVLIIAAVTDVHARRIPNWLTFSTMLAAVAFHSSMKGLEGLLFSLEGMGVGVAVLIIPYLMGGMGAGDAKLMGSVGALLGPEGAFIAFLSTAIVGGIYALAILALHGHLREAAKRYGTILKTFILTKEFIYVTPGKGERMPRLCYGVAIALGTLISVGLEIKF